jgi:hypothetical protein
MSNLRLCPSCDKLSFDKAVLNSKKANWLNEFNFVEDFIKNTPLESVIPQRYNIKKEIMVGSKDKNKFILYWASESNNFNNFKINDAKNAYGDFTNFGVANIDEDGKVVILLRTPQIYSDVNDKGDEEIFFRHFHYILSNSKNTEWDFNNVYTQLLLGYSNFFNLMKSIKSKKTVVLNTLPCEYYGMEHIESSWNLPTEKVLKMSSSEIDDFLKKLIELNYPFINNELNENNFNIKCVPILLYCENEECDLSLTCAKKLTESGFHNISIFNAGMQKYRDYNNNTNNGLSKVDAVQKSIKQILKKKKYTDYDISTLSPNEKGMKKSKKKMIKK